METPEYTFTPERAYCNTCKRERAFIQYDDKYIDGLGYIASYGWEDCSDHPTVATPSADPVDPDEASQPA